MDYSPRIAPRIEPGNALHEVRRPRRDELWVSRTAEEDLQFALSARRNLLVTGQDVRVAAVLHDVLADSETTVIACGNDQLRLPAAGTAQAARGTLVLRDVDTLNAVEQAQLATWIASGETDIHLITTASTSLLQHVDAGSFDATLYYRLNIVYIALDTQ